MNKSKLINRAKKTLSTELKEIKKDVIKGKPLPINIRLKEFMDNIKLQQEFAPR